MSFPNNLRAVAASSSNHAIFDISSYVCCSAFLAAADSVAVVIVARLSSTACLLCLALSRSVFIMVSLSPFIFLSSIHFATSSGVATPSVMSCFFSIVTFAGFISPCSCSLAGIDFDNAFAHKDNAPHTTGIHAHIAVPSHGSPVDIASKVSHSAAHATTGASLVEKGSFVANVPAFVAFPTAIHGIIELTISHTILPCCVYCVSSSEPVTHCLIIVPISLPLCWNLFPHCSNGFHGVRTFPTDDTNFPTFPTCSGIDASIPALLSVPFCACSFILKSTNIL